MRVRYGGRQDDLLNVPVWRVRDGQDAVVARWVGAGGGRLGHEVDESRLTLRTG